MIRIVLIYSKKFNPRNIVKLKIILKFSFDFDINQYILSQTCEYKNILKKKSVTPSMFYHNFPSFYMYNVIRLKFTSPPKTLGISFKQMSCM